LAASAGIGTGTWDDWCAGTPSAGPSSSCGPAWDAFDPSALPSVAIVSPVDGETFLEGTEVAVDIAAAKHPDGFAIASVSLAITSEHTDAITLVDEAEPWQFASPPLPEPGIYTLVAIAEDWAGNRVESASVVIGWGDTEFPDPDTTTDTGDDPPAQRDDAGCVIANDPPLRVCALAAFALAIVLRRRAIHINR
jgi:hypothetical protein